MSWFLRVLFALILALLFLTMPGCTCDDDDDDDDNDDNDDDDNEPVFDYPSDPGIWMGDVYYQQIDGGSPGHSGTSIGVGPDDTRYVAAESGRIIYFCTCDENADCTREHVGYWGDDPHLAIDSNGYAQICYTYDFDPEDYDLKYATNKSGSWVVTTVDEPGSVGEYCAIDLRIGRIGAIIL